MNNLKNKWGTSISILAVLVLYIMTPLTALANIDALKSDILTRIARGDHPIILTIDMQTTQKAFGLELGTPGSQALWKKQKSLLKFANDNNLHVFDINYTDKILLRDKFNGNPEAYLRKHPTYSKLRKTMRGFGNERYHYVVKDTVQIDTSSSSEIATFIRDNDVRSAVVMGFNSDCCVRHSARALVDNQNIDILVSDETVVNGSDQLGISDRWAEIGLEPNDKVKIFRRSEGASCM